MLSWFLKKLKLHLLHLHLKFSLWKITFRQICLATLWEALVQTWLPTLTTNRFRCSLCRLINNRQRSLKRNLSSNIQVSTTSLKFRTSKWWNIKFLQEDRDLDLKRGTLLIRINMALWNLEVKVSFNYRKLIKLI